MHYLADGRVALYRGDGSERCLVCGWRGVPSYYVVQPQRTTDEGLPERFPVCDQEHALMWMRNLYDRVLGAALGDSPIESIHGR